MLALKVVPEILYFDTFKDFNEEFKLGKGDILVTNEWMYNPYVKPLGIDIPVIFQEKYGKGEPSDEMIDAIAKDMKEYSYDRIVAFGDNLNDAAMLRMADCACVVENGMDASFFARNPPFRRSSISTNNFSSMPLFSEAIARICRS